MSDQHVHTDEEIAAIAREAVRPGHTDEQIVKMARTANKAIFFRTLAVAAIALLGMIGFFSAKQYTSAQHASQRASAAVSAVHATQVSACQKSIQPGGVRAVVAAQIQDQLNQSKHVNYHRFFPNIKPRKLKRLIRRQRASQRREITALLNVNCAALYSAP